MRVEFCEEFQTFIPGQEWSGGTVAALSAIVLAGTFGSLFSAVGAPKKLSVGASGAIMGLCGLMLGNLVCKVHLMRRGKAKESAFLQAVVIATCLPLSFLGCVDSYCHIAGYLVGVLVGLALYGSHLQGPFLPRLVPALALLLMVALGMTGSHALASLDVRSLSSVKLECS